MSTQPQNLPPQLPLYDPQNAQQRMQIRSGQPDLYGQRQYKRSESGNYELARDPNRSVNQQMRTDIKDKGMEFDPRQRRIVDAAQMDDFSATQNSIMSAWNQERTRQEEEYAAYYAEASSMAAQPYYVQNNKGLNGWSYKVLETSGSGEIRTRIVNAALSQVQNPNLQYSWGGGGAKGAGYGINANGFQSASVYGFDCSGLVQYAYARAGINIGRHSTAQTTTGRIVGLNQLKPGDIVGWGRTPQTSTHVAVYIGNGYVAEAANEKDDLQVRKLGTWPMDKQAFGVSVLRGV